MEEQKEKIQEVTLDPAQQSLADALKTAFVVLKFTMIILLILYFFSGFFSVGQNEKAIRLRLGKFVGEDGVVEASGFNPGLPYPFEEVFMIEIKERQLELGDSFWFHVMDKDKDLPVKSLPSGYRKRSMDPLKDGYLLMGGKSIIHDRWNVTYGINNELKFAEFVGNDELANELVTLAVEEAIVEKAAASDAESWINATGGEYSDIKRKAQDVLDGLNTGILIKTISSNPIYPITIQSAVEEVNNAITSADQKVIDARKNKINQLNVVAGENYSELVDMIREFELLRSTGTKQEIEVGTRKIEQTIRNLAFDNNKKIGGQVAKLITEATSYKNQIKQKLETEHAVFSAILAQYKANPQVTMARLLQPMRQKVFANDNVETFRIGPGATTIRLNRDPLLLEKRNREKVEKAKKGGK